MTMLRSFLSSAVPRSSGSPIDGKLLLSACHKDDLIENERSVWMPKMKDARGCLAQRQFKCRRGDRGRFPMSQANETRLLEKKVAFVAGASSGINLRIAQRLSLAGAKIAIISRTEERIASAAREIAEAGGTVFGAAADVRDYAAVAAVLLRAREAYGLIDIVVSGAAGNFVAPALNMSARGFKAVVDIDLLGTFNVLRACFEHLNRPGASLISVTAPQAVNPCVAQSHVCAAKAGVNMLTRCLAMEWGPLGVRVNAVSPGPIEDTEGMARLAPTADLRERLRAGIPLRRLGTKDEVADVVLFLCSESSRYITGAVIDCDGGISLVGRGGLMDLSSLTAPAGNAEAD
jgi:NAD(P)-dependent dehydrogenase (short-subunit alcohol dehydrogenase family)